MHGRRKVIHVIPIGSDSVNVLSCHLFSFLYHCFSNCTDRHEYFFLGGSPRDTSQFDELLNSIERRSMPVDWGGSLRLLAKLVLSTSRTTIIFHQLPPVYVRLSLLFLNIKPHLRFQWFIWGGDLYDSPQTNRIFLDPKNTLVKCVVSTITTVFVNKLCKVYGIHGDLEFFNEKFPKANPLMQEILFPPPKLPDFVSRNNSCLNILVGHSGSPSNLHRETFRLLSEKFDGHEDFRVYCLLSYGGDLSYREEISRLGYETFEDRFIPITDFLSPAQFENFISSIDIAFCLNRRQASIQTILLLLASGASVVLNKEVTTFELFSTAGARIFTSSDPNIRESLAAVDDGLLENNSSAVRTHWSGERLAATYRSCIP